jgi:hypothetical protein
MTGPVREGILVGCLFWIGYLGTSCFNQAYMLNYGYDEKERENDLRIKNEALQDFNHSALWNRAWGTSLVPS